VTVEFENDRVRVTRRTASDHDGGINAPGVDRLDRLVIWLRDGRAHRQQGGNHEVLHRKRGDVVWRDASRHVVSLPHDNEHEVLIIELKDPAPQA
jgi:hypothetical protein